MVTKYARKKKRKKKEADAFWHKACIKKYGSGCIFAGTRHRAKSCNGRTDYCHHFLKKGAYGHLRYDIDNGVPLCWPCHFSFENNTDPFRLEYIKNWIGEERYNRLKEKAKDRPTGSYTNLKWYEGHIENLKQIINNE